VKVIRCENDKHFYDADVYDCCPHCRKELAGAAPTSNNVLQQRPEQKYTSVIQNSQAVMPTPDQSKQNTICTACGKFMTGVKKFCTGCGAKLKTPAPAPPAQIQPPQSAKDSNEAHTSSIWEQKHDKPQIDVDQKQPQIDTDQKHGKPQIDADQKHDNPQNYTDQKYDKPQNNSDQKPDVINDPDPLPGFTFPQPVKEESSQAKAKPQPMEKNAEKDLHQAIAAVTSHSASEDEKTVAFYDFGNDESAVVGWLVCTRGEYQGNGYELKSGQNFIGRAQNMSIGLARETSVSRHRHAVIIFDPKKNTFYIQQGESRGLTYLNGELVTTSTLLNAYDKIQLGKAEFAFVPFCCDKFSWDDYVD